jgi:hypothetical protein
MAARLIMPNKPGTRPPTPDRDDNLESFWHVLLWAALRHCEHKLPLNRVIASLHDLFDNMYFDETGQKKGGDAKLSSLTSQTHVTGMALGSLALEGIIIAVAEVLSSRYPGKKEDDVLKVEDMWKAVLLENPNSQEPLDLLETRVIAIDRTFFLDVYPIWRNRFTLKTNGWMEAIFDKALITSATDWETGSANIVRSFPRSASEARKRKRESEINYVNENRKQQKLSDLGLLAE